MATFYKKVYYKTQNIKTIKRDIRKDRFDPILISNEPGFVYHRHKHPQIKLLVFIKGSMKVEVDDKTYHCGVGDKLVIPGNTFHSALVGGEGCTFFWSEKL